MESSENAPASPEQGDDVVPREAARGGEPAREEAPQSSDVDGDASASERATTGDSRERREEGHEVDAGNAPAGGDDSEDDARSDGSDSS